MRFLSIFSIQVLVLLSIVVANEDFSFKIQSVDSMLSNEGPTVNVLEQFEDLVREIETSTSNNSDNDIAVTSHLPRLYYKKALVALSLNKQNSAIFDLKTCLLLDPHMKPARKRLVDLYMERGDFDGIALVLDGHTDGEFGEIFQTIQGYTDAFQRAQSAHSNGDVDSCINELENNVLPVTPNNIDPFKLHAKCVKDKIKVTEQKDQLDDLFRNLIKDYSLILQNQPMLLNNLEVYDEVSSYLLYSQSQFEKSWGIIKSCLRIDNDFKPCGDKSKFFHKFQEFFKILEKYTIMDGFYYTMGDDFATGTLDDSLTVSDEDFKYVYQFLFKDALKASKLEKKKLPYSVSSNYDYLKYNFDNFVKQEELIDLKLPFSDLLNKLACEAHVLNNGGSTSRSVTCGNIVEDEGNPFLPLHLQEIDKLIKKRRFHEADDFMTNKLNKNVRQSRLFKDRYRHIEEYQRMEQQRQQQQQHQQQQQQRRRWQQQQQQQHQQQQQQHNMSPKVDYYKVLDVAKDADEKTIKKAYRTQTLKFHPDKYKGGDLTPDEIEGKMQDINEAYEVLSNKESKEAYDRGGDTGQQQYQQQQGGHHFNFGGFNGDFFNQFTQQGGNVKFKQRRG